MGGYEAALNVEAKGRAILEPYLKSKANRGNMVLTDKGNLSKELQAKYGDAFANISEGKIIAIEFKIEHDNRHNNFFLETWSNLDFDRRNPGWMTKLRADKIWYYFLKQDALYVIDFRKLFDWFWRQGNRRRFKEKLQRKHDQLNKTYGICVPIDVLMNELNVKLFHPMREMCLDTTDDDVALHLPFPAKQR